MTRMHAFAIMVVLVCAAELYLNCLPENAWADEKNQIVKIASQDQSILIKSASGVLRVVHVGDIVEPFGTIQSIYQQQVVFKNAKAETVVLLFKNGKQRLQRISKVNPSSQQPVVKTVTAGERGVAPGEASHGINRVDEKMKK